MVPLIISIVAFFIGGIAVLTSILCETTGDKKVSDACFTIARIFVALGTGFALGLFIYNICVPHRLNTKEYLASEYELKYKIVDYDGKSDTIYVLIPLKLKEQMENGKKTIEKEKARNNY